MNAPFAPDAKSGKLGPIAVLAAMVAGVVVAYLALGGDQLLERLSNQEAKLAALCDGRAWALCSGEVPDCVLE